MARPGTPHVGAKRRHLVATATVILGMTVAGAASRADAHAVFLGSPATLPANSQAAITMNVPHELDDGIYNIDILIAFPGDWSTVSCTPQSTWTCSRASQGGRPTIHFQKASGSAPFQDETFRFVVRTGSLGGAHPIPTIQSYSDGSVSRWIGTSGSENPAPILRSAAAAAPTTTTQRPTATTQSARSTTTITAAAPTTPPSAAAPLSTTTTTGSATTVSSPTSTSIAATATSRQTNTSSTANASSPTATNESAPIAQASGQKASKNNDGDSALPLIAIVTTLLLAAAACGGLLWRKRAAS